MDLPTHYSSTIRTLLRFAMVMIVLALLAGISFQESGRKLTFDDLPGGAHLEALFPLALVHGHFFTIGVLLPIALAGALVLARRVGGCELGARSLKFLTRGYLPFAAVSIALLLYKGYHVLLAARGGETDFAVIDQSFFGGIVGLRHAVYGIAHTAMAVSLAVFCVALFRSLGGKPGAGGS